MSMDDVRLPEILPRLHAFFEGRPEVLVAYLFGSVASDRASRESDVDVAVLLAPERLEELRRGWGYETTAGAELEQVMGSVPVDLVVLNGVGPLLKHQVINHGKVVFSRDESARVRFEVRSAGEYEDFLHHAAIRDRYAPRRTA